MHLVVLIYLKPNGRCSQFSEGA